MISGKHRGRQMVALVLILVLSAGLYIGIASHRPAYHVDEYLTYTLSNGRHFGQVDFLSPYKDVDRFYNDVFGLSSEDTFRFDKPINNARQDAHPPLYYMLVHGVSSLLAPNFNIHIAESINLFFFLLSILLVYLILSEILYSSTKWPLLITLFAALNPGVLNIAVFMRMYLMGMTMCLMLTYLQIKWLKKPSLAYALGLSIISLTGALTHYYFIFFCFFSWFFCLLYILKQKYARRSVLTYLLWPCLAGGLMLVLWPEVIKHVLYRSGRGTQSIWSLQHFGSQLSYYWDNIHANLFGRMLIFILPALLVVYLIRYKKSPKAAAPERQYAVFPLVVAALLLPSLMYFLLVAKISTFYLDERYMSLIYPLCIVLVMLFVAAAAVNRQSPLLRAISIVCCIVLVAGAWWSCDWSYSYRHWEKPIDEINASDASDAIVILSGEDEVWKVWTLYPLHQQVDSVTYIPADQLETAQGLLAGQTGQCLLVSCSKTIKDKINSALPAPQTLTVQEIKFGPSGYFTTYLVRQQ